MGLIVGKLSRKTNLLFTRTPYDSRCVFAIFYVIRWWIYDDSKWFFSFTQTFNGAQMDVVKRRRETLKISNVFEVFGVRSSDLL